MKFIILAAGKSTRTYPLTLTKPKPLLKLANKPILQHTIGQIKDFASEIILVVGYKKELIKKIVKTQFPKLNIKFIEQKQQLGTGHALIQVEKHIKSNFILMSGDDIFFKEDIKKLLKHDQAILVKEVKNPENYGVIEAKGRCLKKIIEKPKRPRSKLVNTGCYLLNKEIFKHLRQIKRSKRNEYELTEAISKTKIYCVKADRWIPITFPWDLIDANKLLLKNLKAKIKGKIERFVTIKGNIQLGKNSIIKSGVYIEGNVIIGDNCTIGPNCYIRGSTSIGDNCKIGQAVEVKNSIIMDSSKVPHLSYVGDSVIGENVNIGAGTTIANLRHDKKIIKSVVKGELIETGRKKFGTIIGDNASIAIKTTIYPGRKIYPEKTTVPGEIIKEDVI